MAGLLHFGTQIRRLALLRVASLWVMPLWVTLAGPAGGAEPRPLGTIAGTGEAAVSVAFAPDGHTLAIGTYDAVRLVDPATRQVTATLKTGNGDARGLAFSPDGGTLAVGDYQTLSLWDVATGLRRQSLTGHTGYVNAVRWTGGRIVSASDDGTVRLWDAMTGEPTRTIAVGPPVQDVAVSRDGTLLAVAAGDAARPTAEGPVSLWDVETGERIAELVGHTRAASAVAFSGDGRRLASAGRDEKVNLYDVPARQAIGFYAGHGRRVNDVSFLAGGALLASVSGGGAVGGCELRLWRPDGETLAAIEPHPQAVLAMAVAPDARTLALASHDGTVSLWDLGPLRDILGPLDAPRP